MREKQRSLFSINLIKLLNVFLLLFALIGISFSQINFNGNSLIVSADTVEDYYAKLDTSKVGTAFRSELAELITTTHKKQTTYGGLADVFKVADADPDKPGNIIWFYTGTSVSFSGFGSGNGSTNREHVWPKDGGRAFDEKSRAGSDGHHLRPTEAQLNSTRGSLSFGIVPTVSGNIVKQNGSTNYKSLCYKANGFFYPGEGYRGATARILMYVQTRWGDEFNLEFVDSAGSCKTIGKISDLLRWHLEEPVTEEEIARNNAVYGIQGNRNPFIDHPEYATKIYCYDGKSYNNALKRVVEEVGDYGEPGPTVSLTELSISGTANKLEYKAGDKFDPTGLTVTGKYSDATSKVLPNSSFKWLDGTNYATTLSEGTTSVKCLYGTIEATYTGITVKKNEQGGDIDPPVTGEGKWRLVTDASSLKNGDKIVIVSQSESKIAGALSNTYLQSLDVTFSDSSKTAISTLPSGALVLTLSKNGNYWELITPSGAKLGATAVKKLSTSGGSTDWTISISDSSATIKNKTESYGRFLYNVTSPRFTTYSSAENAKMLLPRIYSSVEGGGSDTPHTCTFDKMVVSDNHKATDATCTKKATYYYSCECGKNGTNTFEAGELGSHSMNKIVLDKYKATDATCTKKATYYYSCECGKVFSETFEAGELKPHTKHKVVLDKYKASEATCKTKATYYYSCDCGKVFSETFEDGDLKEHKIVIDEGIEATCYRYGLTSGEHCSECGTIIIAQATLGKLPHKFTWVVDKAATTESTGIKHEECSVCKEKRNENTVIDKLTHAHKMEFVEGTIATCESDGSKSYYFCSVCEKKYEDITGNIEINDLVIKALGHSYTKAKYEFDFANMKCYGVSVCDHDEKHIKKVEVSLTKEIITEVSCYEDGKILYKAMFSEKPFSNQEEYQYQPALEHEGVTVKGYPSTCSKKGLTDGKICARCHKVLVQQLELPMLEHEFGNWLYTKNPTSQEEGEIRRVCSHCQITDTKKVEYPLTIKEIKNGSCIISADDLGALVKDSELLIDDISEEYLEEKISDFSFNKNIKNINSGRIMRVYDISIVNDGSKVQPNGKVRVSILVDFDLSKNHNYLVAYVNDGQMIIHEASINDGYISFETDHFSNYAILEVEDSRISEGLCITAGILVLATITVLSVMIVKKRKKYNN